MRALADQLIRLPASSRRWWRWGRLGVAALCLLLALATALGSARTTGRAAAPPTATTSVTVATRDLPAGAVLHANDVDRAQWPRTLAATLPRVTGPVVGRRLAGPIGHGEPITSDRLLGGDLTAGLPPGTLAVGVEISGGPAGIIRAGDRIDVIATRAQSSTSAAAGAPVVVASRALVLATTRPDIDPAAPAYGGSGAAVVLATSRPTAVRLAGLAATAEFTAVLDPP